MTKCGHAQRSKKAAKKPPLEFFQLKIIRHGFAHIFLNRVLMQWRKASTLWQ